MWYAFTHWVNNATKMVLMLPSDLQQLLTLKYDLIFLECLLQKAQNFKLSLPAPLRYKCFQGVLEIFTLKLVFFKGLTVLSLALVFKNTTYYMCLPVSKKIRAPNFCGILFQIKQMSSLEEQPVLFTAETYLQPPLLSFYIALTLTQFVQSSIFQQS